MPASPLPDADVSKIVAYIRSLRATAIDTPVQGDAEHGARIFNGKGGCRECHMVNGRGGLLRSGSFKHCRREKCSMLYRTPNKTQAAHCAGVSARGCSDQRRSEHPWSPQKRAQFLLQLLDMNGKLHLLSRSDLRDIQYEKDSLMPANYDKTLNRNRTEGLLAFLSRQGVRSRRGQPETPVRRALALRCFVSPGQRRSPLMTYVKPTLKTG